jgi:outer membrane lipoprotein
MCMGKYVAVILLLAVLSGCASNPIAQDLRKQAQPLTHTQVIANPKTTTGSIVIWGGRIINLVNTNNGGEIYVLQLPLSRRSRPTSNDSASSGRFIAVSPEFLDPVKYPGGSLITVAGQLNGVRNERLQSVYYRYPLLDIKQIYFWTKGTTDYYYNYESRSAPVKKRLNLNLQSGTTGPKKIL